MMCLLSSHTRRDGGVETARRRRSFPVLSSALNWRSCPHRTSQYFLPFLPSGVSEENRSRGGREGFPQRLRSLAPPTVGTPPASACIPAASVPIQMKGFGKPNTSYSTESADSGDSPSDSFEGLVAARGGRGVGPFGGSSVCSGRTLFPLRDCCRLFCFFELVRFSLDEFSSF